MKRRNRKRSQKVELPVINPNTAAIDVGSVELYVCVPADRDPEPVQHFSSFTPDIHSMADWLEKCGVKSVAMESTGVFWIPVYQILEQRGFEVCLVNARHVKNVPGRKTDVSDCQWLQYLHAVGLLRGSFRPADQICVLRSLLRHRDHLIEMASCHVQHMQKALDQMNLHLHHVISDITGKTGLAILDAILAGERHPDRLAELRDRRIKASPELIAKALTGDYRTEHVFTLRQSLSVYRQYQQLILDCDHEIQAQLKMFDSRIDLDETPLPPATTGHRKPQGNDFRFDLRSELYRILGFDLTQVPGFQAANVYAVYAELGCDLSKFSDSAHFSSWLGVCPDNRISGGKILSVHTRHVKNRVTQALRMAASSLERSCSPLGDYYRRMRARLGPPGAITATAHKLARILYKLITSRQPYDETILFRDQDKQRKRAEAALRRRANALGFQLIPIPKPE
jgi:transposase